MGRKKKSNGYFFLHVLAPRGAWLRQKFCRAPGGVAAPKILPTKNSPCPPASHFIYIFGPTQLNIHFRGVLDHGDKHDSVFSGLNTFLKRRVNSVDTVQRHCWQCLHALVGVKVRLGIPPCIRPSKFSFCLCRLQGGSEFSAVAGKGGTAGLIFSWSSLPK